MRKSIAKNYIYNLTYQILSILLPVITTPYLSRVLGAENIGIYGYTISIVTYFILFGTLGISMYGQREIAYKARDKKEQSRTFFEVISLRAITLTISIITFYIIFGRSGDYKIYYRILIIQLVANLFDISWFFQGIEEFDKTVIRNSVIKLLSLVLIFVLVKKPEDLWLYFLIYVGAELIGNLTLWLYIPKYLEKISIKDLNFKKHLKPTISLFIPQIAIQIYTVLDKTMIGAIMNNMEEVGYYEQAQKIIRATLTVVTALQTVMNSRIATSYINNDKDEVKLCLEKSFNFIWILSIPMMFGFIAISPKFVPWFYGDGFEAVTPILIATAPILVVLGLNGVTGIEYLVQTGKQKIFTISVTIGAIVNVILNLILIHFFGGIGAAIASVLAELSVLSVQLKYFKSQFSIFQIMKMGSKCIISGIVMYIVVYTVAKYLDISIFNTMLEIIIGGVTYVLLLIVLKYRFFLDLMNQLVNSVKNKLKRGDINEKN